MKAMPSDSYREQLLALRARLRGDVNQMVDVAFTENGATRMPIHMAELGSESFDRELALKLLGSERNALDLIESAIARLDDGSYGRCVTCGARIPRSRLEAIPYAAQCVRCASEQEGASLQLSSTRQKRARPR